MCGRFTLTASDHRALGRRFGADFADEALGRLNVAPTESIVVVHEGKEGGREAHVVRWGLVPPWAKEVKGPPMINARAESLSSRRPFSGLVDKPRNRCLVVADGFYEWLRPEDRKQKPQPFLFRLAGGEPFAFAGLWTWAKPQGEWLASATIVTCPPNPLVERLHDRMPVILPGPEAEEAWLSSDLSVDDAVTLCCPLDPDRMTVEPADQAVNRTDGQAHPVGR